MIICGTGHRPDKIWSDDPYSYINHIKLSAFAMHIISRWERQPTAIISGMALGWDLGLAEAAIGLGIPLIAAVPFVGQERRWPRESRELYHNLLNEATGAHIVTDGPYAVWKMFKRNQYMVDNSDMVFAFWNGDETGGTANTVKYAKKRDKPIYIVNHVQLDYYNEYANLSNNLLPEFNLDGVNV